MLTVEKIDELWGGHTVPVFGKTGINPVVFARAIEAEARRDALEEAAKLCESQWSNAAEKMYGAECAAAIRAIKADPPPAA